MTHFFTHHGLWLLPLVVGIESFGIPLPGETALIFFAIAAANGHYSIEWVIGLAALGAIVGDNAGYWIIGRWGGRALFRRWGWLNQYAERVLPRAERIMQRHGGKTVFFGRFITVLRYTAAWIAGIAHMDWWRFLFWNASGGICWAVAVGLAGYYGGHAAEHAIERYGLWAGAAIVAALVIGWIGVHFAKREIEERL